MPTTQAQETIDKIAAQINNILGDVYSLLPQEKPNVSFSLNDNKWQIKIASEDTVVCSVIRDAINEIIADAGDQDHLPLLLNTLESEKFLKILTEKHKQSCLSSMRDYLNKFNLTSRCQSILNKAKDIELPHIVLAHHSMRIAADEKNTQGVERALSNLPTVLKLKIPCDSDSGIFDAHLIYPKRGYESPLNQHLKFAVTPDVDFFTGISGLQIIYDDKIITLPQQIMDNLLKYLTETYKLYNIATAFTCHQFCGLIKTGEFYEIKTHSFTYSSARHHHLSPGEVVQFICLKDDLDNLEINVMHSAMYLGQGIYLSKNGVCFPAIFTLDALLAIYPANYLNVATHYVLTNGTLKANLSLLESFKNKAFVRNSLCFRVLAVVNETFQQLDLPAIRQAYRRMSAKFHPDKTSLPPQKAKAYLEVIQKVYAILNNPITRSDYYTSLLAGRDWSVAKIVGISRFSKNPHEIIDSYHHFIDLLEELGQGSDAIKKAIKSEADYLDAVEATKPPVLNGGGDVVLHISNRTLRTGDDDPYLPSEVRFSGQSERLEGWPHFQMSEATRIDDLLVTFGNPVDITITRSSFTEDDMQSNQWMSLPPDLVSYTQIMRAFELLDLYNAKERHCSLNLVSTYYKSKLVGTQPGGFVFFSNATGTGIINVGVYLGGNFYVYLTKNREQFCIANTASIINQKVVSFIWSLSNETASNHATPQESLQNAFETGTAKFTITESFPLFPHEMSEQFKRYLLTLNESRKYDFMLALKGVKVLNANVVPHYNYNSSREQHVILPGQHVLLCKNTTVITSALHLGNYNFLLPTSIGFRVVNLLMLTESADWDNLFIIQEPKQEGKGHFSADIYLHRKFVQLQEIIPPLLYALLGIQFDLNRLCDIDESTILNCYLKKAGEIKDAYQKEVITIVFQLLMNDYFRVFYATEVLFGKEREFNVSQLLNITRDMNDIEKLQRYAALTSLIENTVLKNRIIRQLLGFDHGVKAHTLLSAINDEYKHIPQYQFNALVDLLKCLHHDRPECFLPVIAGAAMISSGDYQLALSFCMRDKNWQSFSQLLRNKTTHLTVIDFNKLAAIVSEKDDIEYVMNDPRTSPNTRANLRKKQDSESQPSAQNRMAMFSTQASSLMNDRRFVRSSEPGVLYKATSTNYDIGDGELRAYGFSLDQCVRSKEDSGLERYVTIYKSAEIARIFRHNQEDNSLVSAIGRLF